MDLIDILITLGKIVIGMTVILLSVAFVLLPIILHSSV